MRVREMNVARQWSVRVLAVAGAASIVYFALLGMFGEPIALAQSDRFLEQRITQVEQRFYGLESRLNRLESGSRPTVTAPPRLPITGDLELQSLRTQVDGLRLRLGETECGLLKLDERTLTAAARLARGKGRSEVCRLAAASPIQLSARP